MTIPIEIAEETPEFVSPEPAPKKRGKSWRPGEPTFADLSTALAAADLKARSASADAGAARAERSTVAVNTIKAAFAESQPPEDVRTTLLGAGVLKGTVSKIVTVLNALMVGSITPTDVKSLNGAYSLVKLIARTGSAAAAAGVGPAVMPVPAAPAKPVVATTPEEALKIILSTITAEKDADKAFKLGGEWITKVTNAITDALKRKSGEEEE